MDRKERSELIATFQSLYGDLLRIVASRTGSPDRAADIVQDTYYRLATTRPMEQGIANPRAYIIRIAQNLAVDEGRRLARSLARSASEEEALALRDPAPLVEQAILARERLRLLDEALRELPDNVRQALLLNRVEGLTQAEIARRLGISESMVVKYVAQALKHCRDWRRRVDS